MPNEAISQFPVAVTTPGLSYAAIQNGANVQVPQSLLDAKYLSSISVANGNGFSGSFASSVLTISTTVTGVLKGDGTAISAALANIDYQSPISLTTTGTNGAATFVGNVLNVPNYSSATGTVTHTAGALTASALVVGNAGADIKVLASLGTTTTVLHGNAAGLPTFGAVALAADVSGTLPVANGGTGASSLTANNVLLGNGTSALQVVAPGTSGNVLTSNGTTWASSATTGNSFTLLGTLSPSSVASISLTGIASGYRYWSIELDTLTLTNPSTASFQIAVSSTNGAAYGSTGNAGGGGTTVAMNGAISVNGVSCTAAAAKTVSGYITSPTGTTVGAATPTNTAAVANAIQFSASQGTMSGTIRIYGVK